jgi:hypothetical protein
VSNHIVELTRSHIHVLLAHYRLRMRNLSVALLVYAQLLLRQVRLVRRRRHHVVLVLLRLLPLELGLVHELLASSE